MADRETGPPPNIDQHRFIFIEHDIMSDLLLFRSSELMVRSGIFVSKFPREPQ